MTRCVFFLDQSECEQLYIKVERDDDSGEDDSVERTAEPVDQQYGDLDDVFCPFDNGLQINVVGRAICNSRTLACGASFSAACVFLLALDTSIDDSALQSKLETIVQSLSPELQEPTRLRLAALWPQSVKVRTPPPTQPLTPP